MRLAFPPNQPRQQPLPGDRWLSMHLFPEAWLGSLCWWLCPAWAALGLLTFSALGSHQETQPPPAICHWHQKSWAFEVGQPGKTLGSGGDFGGLQSPCHPWRDICLLPAPPLPTGAKQERGLRLQKPDCFSQEKPKIRDFYRKVHVWKI